MGQVVPKSVLRETTWLRDWPYYLVLHSPFDPASGPNAVHRRSAFTPVVFSAVVGVPPTELIGREFPPFTIPYLAASMEAGNAFPFGYCRSSPPAMMLSITTAPSK